jgi:hypothetical protein
MERNESDVLTESAPEKVWLQVDTDGDSEDRSQPIQRENWSDLTWCYESIGGQEVVYVREDIAQSLLTALVQARDELESLNRGIGWRDGKWHSVTVANAAIALATSANLKEPQSP